MRDWIEKEIQGFKKLFFLMALKVVSLRISDFIGLFREPGRCYLGFVKFSFILNIWLVPMVSQEGFDVILSGKTLGFIFGIVIDNFFCINF